MIDYTAILSRKYKGSQWTLNGDDYTGLVWLSDTTKPTKSELDKQWDEVQEIIANEAAEAEAQRQALLDKLGITEDEAKLLLSQKGMQ